MVKSCSGPSSEPGTPCGRPVTARGLCVGHYRQLLALSRSKGIAPSTAPERSVLAALTPLRTARGLGGRVTVRAEQGLITAMAVSADEDGIEEPEAWRRAALGYLAARRKQVRDA
jgi:hypothetical protein